MFLGCSSGWLSKKRNKQAPAKTDSYNGFRLRGTLALIEIEVEAALFSVSSMPTTATISDYRTIKQTFS